MNKTKISYQMKRMYRHIGVALGMLLMFSCSEDPLQEESGLIPGNPDKGAEKLPPNEQWAWVGAYPGEVSNSVTRLDSVEVKIRGDYDPVDLKFKSSPGYLQSSGLYVPQAERVVVNYAGGADNLHYRIGIACWELADVGQYLRYEKVYADGVLVPGENVISCNFGGHLYFYYDGAPKGDATVTVRGAVRSPDYTLDESNLQEWSNAVNDSISPMIWGEIAGRNLIMTLPVRALKRIDRPDVFLKFYDELIETDFNFFGGISGSDMVMPWRIYSDVQLPEEEEGTVSKFYPYYPMGYVANSSDSIENRLLDFPYSQIMADTLLLQGFANLYRMNWNSGSFSGKYLMKLPVYHFFQRKGKWADFQSGFGEFRNVGERYNLPGDVDKKSVVVQLVQKYGWNLLSYIAEKSREEFPEELPDLFKDDLLPIYASEYANTDLTEFFEVWGYPLTSYAKSYMKNYPAPGEKFWENADPLVEPADRELTPGNSNEKMWPIRDTIYDTSEWMATASSVSPVSAGEGPANNLIDGDKNTHWHSQWAGDVPDYPHWFQMDFAEPLWFNYVTLVQRKHDNPGPKTFTILVRTDPESEDFTEVEEGRRFYLCRDANTQTEQRFFLENDVYAYSVRIMLLEGFERTEGGNNREKYAALSEFSVGLLQ